MAEPLMSQSQGLVTKLQSVGDTLEFFIKDMPDGVSRFRVSNFGFFATDIAGSCLKGNGQML